MRDLNHISRRSVLAGLAASGALAGSPSNCFAFDSKGEPDSPILSQEARGRSSAALLHYFAESAPKLLRDPSGILKHPSVAPSLPGKTYSTNLWDWDTLWT